MEEKAVCIALIFVHLLQPAWCVSHHVDRRSSNGDPNLQITASHFLNTKRAVVQGTSYEYGVTVKHSPESKADALAVHVTWILTPFLKFTHVTSWPTAAIYQIQERGDSVTFKVENLPLRNETHFNFSVMFDSEKSLWSGWHHIVTPVQLLYYKEYNKDQHGHVLAKGIPISSPLQTVAFAVEVPGCSSPLGMASGAIKDYQLTASSTYSDRQPNQARPSDGCDAWCAALTNDQQFIQLDFTRMTRIIRIATYGRKQKHHWVKRYMVQYSSDGTIWHSYTENGFTKEFMGNIDKSTPVFHFLANSIETSSIRIRPLAWEELVCMRFEVYGCSIESSPVNCIYPLGLESGYIPDEALSHSVDTTHTPSNPSDIRLNKVPKEFPNGWQAAVGELDYLQIDFGSLRKVTSIATQGSAGSHMTFFVKSFQLKYSNNSIDWQEYKENGNLKELHGPKDDYEAKYAVMARLQEPVVARYVRLIPTAASTYMVMRAELYGCMVEPMPPYHSVPEYSRRSILLNPKSGWLYVCMYSEHSSESSCFSSNDGQDWINLDEFIIGVLALDPLKREIFGVDRSMQFHLSTNNGISWKMVSSEYFYEVKKQNSLVMSTGLPENTVSVDQSSFWSAASSNGLQWAVSSSGVQMMAAGQKEWRTVATWRCCGN